jgi:hypothetical protein
MRWFLSFCVLTAILLAGLMLLSIAVGAQQPTNRVMRGFVEGCADIGLACWYGITPDATIQQMADVFQRYGYRYQQGTESIIAYLDDCLFSYSYESGHLHFSSCHMLRVGDVMDVLQQPTLIMGCNFGEAILGYNLHTFFYLKQVITEPLTPYSEVQEFTILSDTRLADIQPDLWHGFAPFWHYRRLEPTWLNKCLPRL